MHIQLIDANALSRAPVTETHSDREPLEDAKQGAARLLNAVRHRLERAPDNLLVVLWNGSSQWRTRILPAYIKPKCCPLQDSLAQASLAHLPIVQLSHPHAEAADLAWGLAAQLSRQGHLVTLESEEPNWLQAVANRVSWQSPRNPRQKVELQGFFKSSGFLTPASVSHTRALTGVPSLGVVGVPGLDAKRAQGLIAKYKTASALLEATQDFTLFSQEPAYAHALMNPEVQDLLTLNLKVLDLPSAPALIGDDCRVTVSDWDSLDFYDILGELRLAREPLQFAHWQRLGERPATATVSGIQTITRILGQMRRA